MKYNSGDMDDLFRRASDRYPLRTDSADWDRLAGALDGEPWPPSGNENERRRRRGVFWWLILLPLVGAGYLTWHTALRNSKPHGDIVQTATPNATGEKGQPAMTGTASAQSAATGNKAAAAHGLTKTDAGREKATNTPTSAAAHGAAVNASPTGRTVGTAANENGTMDGMAARATNSGVKARRITAAAGGQRGRHYQPATATRTESVRGIAPAAGARVAGSEDVAGVARSRDVSRSGDVARLTATVMPAENREPAWALLDLRRAPIGEWDPLDLRIPAPVAKAVSQERQTPPPTNPASHRSHGYIGLIGAPDLSTVKFQRMKGIGTTFGLLLGYSFNDHWAIESGVYVDRKRYYTDGEYFNTSKVRLYPNEQLLNVDGTCYMWEIPVNVRYNFSTGSRMHWFGTAGLSTYLMSRENYNYQYEYTGGGPVEDNHWNINQPSQYLFSILNVSAGFEQRLGTVGNLRVEPYIRVPMSGIGTGNLPIMSAGVNIGLTRTLW